MRYPAKLLGLLFIVFGIASVPAHACSAFLMKGDDYCVVGFNENWQTMPGMVIVNQRGITKRGLSWNELVSPKRTEDSPITWTSKYGSVSFSLLGIDLPCYGVNEKGLFIVELYLPGPYAASDKSKPSLFWGQWIQYQLDNYGTVQELVQALDRGPTVDWWPEFAGSHFFIADANGDTAAIDWLDGKPRVQHGATMPVPLLCNGRYEQEYSVLQKYQGFGGDKPFDVSASNWGERFTKAAYLLQRYDSKDAKPVDYAWNLLDSVTPGQWQLVYDTKAKTVYYRSDVGWMIKAIKMDELNFTKTDTVLFTEINTNGDFRSLLKPVTYAEHQDYVRRGFIVGYPSKEFPTSKEYTNLLSKYDSYIASIYGITPAGH